MRRTLVVTLLVCASWLMVPSTQAQQPEESVITYGEAVTGEITNQNFEVSYRLTGNKDDYIFIDYQYEVPAIVILNSDFEVWRAYELDYGDSMTIIEKLPYAGDYIIIASRSGGRAGDTTGEFSLKVDLVPTMVRGKLIEGIITSDGVGAYYIYEGEAPFTVNYQYIDGTFAPELRVALLDFVENTWERGATVNGDQIGEISLTISQTEPRRDYAYVIYVLPEEFYYSSDVNRAHFRVRIE